ncbi:hypothetical protein B0H14DRAFT_292676 [Mycena olivaceomarginata]|nr:hypothetical protein B0H14DRAFT_292676 [Mycena olivaceomarginata]
MCWTDTFQKGFSCGATTGQMMLRDGTVFPTPANSTRNKVKCAHRKDLSARYSNYRNQMVLAHQPLLAFEHWMAAMHTGPCNTDRYYAGVQKYARHCVMDRTGNHGACLQVNQPHKYPYAPGFGTIALNDIDHPFNR